MSKDKFLLTHSLLSSWEWIFKTDNGYEDFMRTLRREPMKTISKDILDGRQYENMVSAFNSGFEVDEKHKWYKGISETAAIVRGSAEQVKVSKDVVINGINFVLYGILDNLKAGVIFDTKMSKHYSYGKYKDSTQHKMYFELVPEAYKFEYIIFNGKDVFTEDYYPYDTEPIENTIKHFMRWLDEHNLTGTYCSNWKSKY